MPQGKNSQKSAPCNKKSGGRAPRHANRNYAFRHNPKSKKTDAILSMPNVGVCRRCRDKIEWRKTYRRYKPRTKPGSCNLCGERRVSAAYHTICDSCAVGDVALSIVARADVAVQEGGGMIGGGERGEERDAARAPRDKDTDSEEPGPEQEVGNDDNDDHDDNNADDNGLGVRGTKGPPLASTASSSQTQPVPTRPKPKRACAVCVRKPALGGDGSDDDGDNIYDDKIASLLARLSTDPNRKPLKLRERKALERRLQQLREAKKEDKKKRKEMANNHEDAGEAEEMEGRRTKEMDDDGLNSYDDDDDDNDDDDDDDYSNPPSDHDEGNRREDESEETENGIKDNKDDNEEYDDDDPFLKAIGGKDKMLVGDAYQKMLLERESRERNA